MKELYLKDLRNYLVENKIDDVDEIISKYEKRYNFGLEAEMSEEEIEKMLGTKEDILEKFKNPDAEKKFNEYVENELDFKPRFNLICNTVSDDIEIIYYDEEKIKVSCEDVDVDSYEVKVDNENGVKVDYQKTKFFGLNRRKPGLITIKLPHGKKFDRIQLSTTSGDIKTDKLEGNVCYINTVSGDYELGEVITNKFEVNNVSGDFEINRLASKVTIINNVSGDFDIFLIEGNKATIDSVSGDITISKSNVPDLNCTAISGDVEVNGEEFKSLGKKIKGVFKK